MYQAPRGWNEKGGGGVPCGFSFRETGPSYTFPHSIRQSRTKILLGA